MSEGRRRGSEETKERLLQAALASLREDGYAGTSIRSVAARAGMNSALISYHFGGINELLLAALDRSSAERMEEYRAVMESAATPEEFMATATQIYRRDVEQGHITVFSELVGASLSHPELRPEIIRRAEPWIAFVEAGVKNVLTGSPLEGIFPTDQLAYAILAFYLGVNLFTMLDEDHSRTEGLFELAERSAPLLQPLLRPGPVSGALVKQMARRTTKKATRARNERGSTS